MIRAGNDLKRWGPRGMEWFSEGTRMEIRPEVKCPAGYYKGSRKAKREEG